MVIRINLVKFIPQQLKLPEYYLESPRVHPMIKTKLNNASGAQLSTRHHSKIVTRPPKSTLRNPPNPQVLSAP
jgi:hypothetical protein